MTYEQAMAAVRKRGRPVAVLGDLHVGWRFGRYTILSGTARNLDYTPTQDDMRAADWRVVYTT